MVRQDAPVSIDEQSDGGGDDDVDHDVSPFVCSSGASCSTLKKAEKAGNLLQERKKIHFLRFLI